jgi:formylglycine-generating enzyme required for sulfatase activity
VSRRSGVLVAAAALLLLAWGPPRGASEPRVGDTEVNSPGMSMVWIPAGRFEMGSPPGAPLRQEEETLHEVVLTRPFRISATEVTQEQWTTLMPFNRSPQEGADRPVTSVSWRDAVEFCRRLSEKEGVSYRLPTEAEWEYACRAGGHDPGLETSARDEIAWYADDSGGTTHPVATKEPNAWGLFDTLGNAAEWTADAYGPYPEADEVRDPTGAADGATKVVRGGAFRSFPPALRCAARTGMSQAYQVPHVGFRVVRDVEWPRPVRER